MKKKNTSDRRLSRIKRAFCVILAQSLSCVFRARVTPVTNCRMSSLLREDILQASTRLKPYIRRTPLEYSPWLSDEGKSKVYVKLGEWRKLSLRNKTTDIGSIKSGSCLNAVVGYLVDFFLF